MSTPQTKMSVSPLPLQKSRKRSQPKLLFVALPIVLLGAGIGIFAASSRQPHGTSPSSLRLAGQNAGSQSSEETTKQLTALAEKWKKTPVRLSFAPETKITRTYTPPAGKLGLSVDIPATVKALLAQSENNGPMTRLAGFFGRGQATTVTPLPTVDLAKLRAYLKKQVARDTNRRAKNATITGFTKSGFTIRKERTGLKLDEKANEEAIARAWKTQLAKFAQDEATPQPVVSPPETPLSSGEVVPQTPPQNSVPQKPTPQTPVEVTLALSVVTPKITAVALKDLKEISSFTTHFGGTGGSRGSNIALATGKINGTLIAPGDIFSYNQIVGPRSQRAGFLEAPVIVKGELVPGIGGGICQVSSTLYNAVLRSNLKVVTRSHHAFPVHYLPAGCDATVVDGAIDFKFQNSTSKPLYIASSSRGGRLNFRLLGEKKPGQNITVERTNLATLPHDSEMIRDPSLFVGRSRVKDGGHSGHRVTVYRVIKENGKVVKRELVSRDYYRPFPSVILVGTKRRPVKIVPKPTNPTAPGVAPALQPGQMMPTTPSVQNP